MRLRKQIVIAAMVVMQMADDDVLDAFRRDAERGKAVAHRLDHLALALLAHRLVEAGIDDDGAGRTDDRPDEKVERLQHVVRIAVDEIHRRTARMMAVLDRVNLVDVLAHARPHRLARAVVTSPSVHMRQRRRATKNPGAAGAGVLYSRYANNATHGMSRRRRSELSVFPEHRAAFVADAPAMGGKRRAAMQEVAPGHAAGVVAQPRGGRPARRQLGEIDGVGGGGGKAKQKACGYQ